MDRAPPARDLSPLRSESPGSPYRTCFSTECEALVLPLGHAQSRAPPSPSLPRRPSTVEGEGLTSLEPSSSSSGTSMPGPAEEQSGQGAEPPASPCSRTADALPEDEDDPYPTGPSRRRLAPSSGHVEKLPYGVLLDAGQIPHAAVGSRPTAPCAQKPDE
ncbi:hypothetical protein lerEdw1_009118 [Lerista edwardsae]|nr:hypothetical protein lerEdw1_009118 [Lerista edwardsae]